MTQSECNIRFCMNGMQLRDGEGQLLRFIPQYVLPEYELILRPVKKFFKNFTTIELVRAAPRGPGRIAKNTSGQAATPASQKPGV